MSAIQSLSQVDRKWIIMETSFDGSPHTRWTKEEINSLKSSQENRKVIAYLSIGEAETYRGYWQSLWLDEKGLASEKSPSWLGDENPHWKGNFKVHYWDLQWQSIILEELDKILLSGFDGVYLDIVDAFEYYEYDTKSDKWLDHRLNPKTGQSYRKDMIEWVSKVAQHGRRNKDDFKVIPQNGSQLIEDPSYLSMIDGIGVEDLIFENGKIRSSFDDLPQLLKAREHGKQVFLIEYGTIDRMREHATTFSKKNDLPILITDRKLTKTGHMILP